MDFVLFSFGAGSFLVEVQFYPSRSYTTLPLLGQVTAMAVPQEAGQDSIFYKNTSYLQGSKTQLCF